MYYNYWAAAMAGQQMAGSGQSGQQQSNAQAYMPVMQGQGYPMFGMYSQQYGFVKYLLFVYICILYCILYDTDISI